MADKRQEEKAGSSKSVEEKYGFRTLNQTIDLTRLRQKRELLHAKARKDKHDELKILQRYHSIFIQNGVEIEEMEVNDLSHESECFDDVYSSSEEDQLKAMQKVTLSLISNSIKPIDHVINSGIILRIIDFLQESTCPKLVLEATKVIALLLTGTVKQSDVILKLDAATILINLLSSQYEMVPEQAAWGLGNIACISGYWRGQLIDRNILEPLCELIIQKEPLSLIRTTAWTIMHLCRSRRYTRFEKILEKLPVIVSILDHEDSIVLTDICSAISYFCINSSEKIQQVLDSGICEPLVKLLMHDETDVIMAVIRVCINISYCNHLQIDKLLKHDVIKYFNVLLLSENIKLESAKKDIILNICRFIRNIIDNYNIFLINNLIDTHIFGSMLSIFYKVEFEIQQTIIEIITHILQYGVQDQINYLVRHKCLVLISSLLTFNSPEIILVGLNAFETILKCGTTATRTKTFLPRMKKSGILSKLKFIQCHEDHNIYKKAFNIINKYF